MGIARRRRERARDQDREGRRPRDRPHGKRIVHVCAQAGYEVVAREVEEAYWKKAFEKIGGFMQKSVEKEKMSAADREAALSRMSGTTDSATSPIATSSSRP